MRKVLFLTTLVAFVLTSSAWAADISGSWTVTMKSPMGQDETFDLAIKAAGEKLTITGTHPQLQAMEGTGTLKGDAVTMDLTAASMGIKFAFTGKVAGNKMSGTRKIDMSGMSAGGGQGGQGAGGQGGAPAAGGQGGAPAAGGQGGAPAAGGQGGVPAAGGQGGAPAAGGQGGAPAAGGQGGAPAAGGQGGAPAAGGQGGAPAAGGQGGAGGGQTMSNDWTAERTK